MKITFSSNFGKSEETEISEGHLSDCLGVPGSEIVFLTYMNEFLNFQILNILEN